MIQDRYDNLPDARIGEKGPLPGVPPDGSGVLSIPAQKHAAGLTDIVKAFLELVKIKITFFVGMSAVFGFVLASGDISIDMIMASFGIFLVACGSAVLNHYQERSTDALMHRTRKRPLPSGLVAPSAALVFLLALVVAGSVMTYAWGNAEAVVLSLLAMIWYNGIYTPLKKSTPYAVIPGSFVGSLPVMAGWAAAGGNLLDPRLLAVFVYFFIWQIPHFWLLMDIYSVDYERAGFPTMRSRLQGNRFAIFTYALIVVLVISSLFFLSTGVVTDPIGATVLVALGVWLAYGSFRIVKRPGEKLAYKAAFMKINIYVLSVTVVVLVDTLFKLISPWRL